MEGRRRMEGPRNRLRHRLRHGCQCRGQAFEQGLRQPHARLPLQHPQQLTRRIIHVVKHRAVHAAASQARERRGTVGRQRGVQHQRHGRMFAAQRRDLGVIVAGDRKERVRDDHVHRFVAEQVGGVRPVERHEQAMLASHGLAESNEAHGVYAGRDVHNQRRSRQLRRLPLRPHGRDGAPFRAVRRQVRQRLEEREVAKRGLRAPRAANGRDGHRGCDRNLTEFGTCNNYRHHVVMHSAPARVTL